MSGPDAGPLPVYLGDDPLEPVRVIPLGIVLPEVEIAAFRSLQGGPGHQLAQLHDVPHLMGPHEPVIVTGLETGEDLLPEPGRGLSPRGQPLAILEHPYLFFDDLPRLLVNVIGMCAVSPGQ